MESETQKAILELLAYKKIFSWRNNSGAFPVGEGRSRRFVRFGHAGSPDIIAVIAGRFVGIEVKTKTGRQSPAQKEFQAGLEAAGGLYILARSVDEVWGIIRPLLYV